eukprot:5171783-Amphidinium_carterae.1
MDIGNGNGTRFLKKTPVSVMDIGSYGNLVASCDFVGELIVQIVCVCVFSLPSFHKIGSFVSMDSNATAVK